MGKLTASMVVDLEDKTGRKTQAIIGNMSRLKRAERDYALAASGARLSRRDQAMEQVLVARQQEALDAARERKGRMLTLVTRGSVAAAAVATGAAKAYTEFAKVERDVNRILINADKGGENIKPTMSVLQRYASDYAMSIDDILAGFKALIASGQSYEQAMAFLPSVIMTAQATGAAVDDIARSGAALATSLGISASDMQSAYDKMAASGKLGQFEANDMAQYLPTLAAGWASLGYKGKDSLDQLFAMLQIVRQQAGTSGEAATYLGNMLNGMLKPEVANRFKKFGIDLPNALAKVKREGGDVNKVFLDLTNQAVKGDLSRLGDLFGDDCMLRAVRALLSLRPELAKFQGALKNVDGTSLKDLNQVLQDSQTKLDRLWQTLSRFGTQVGGKVADAVNPPLEAITKTIDEAEAQARAIEMAGGKEEANKDRIAFHEQYGRQHPDSWVWERDGAYRKALVRRGRGEINSVFADLDLQDARQRGGEATARYLSRGSYGADRVARGGYNPADGTDEIARYNVPVPMQRPETGSHPQFRYPSRGTYESDLAAKKRDRERKRGWFADTSGRLSAEQQRLSDLKQVSLGTPTDTMNIRQSQGEVDRLSAEVSKLREALSFNKSDAGAQAVKIEGAPAVTITSPVTIANPPPRPNISVNMSVTINEATNTQAVAQQLGQQIREEMNSLQADTNYAAGF